MKRLLLCLLAAVLLLTACSGGTADPSGGSETTSAETSESTNEGIRQTLVSVGKPYTSSVAATESYPDKFGVLLTDGQKVPDNGAHYVDPRMVGFKETCTFQIDLGEDGKRISAVVARCLNMNIDGVGLAPTARISGSNDGKTFTTIGTRAFPDTGVLTVSSVKLELEEPTDYRYIRVRMSVRSGSHFFFLDELEVYADVDEKEKADTVTLAYQSEEIDRNAWLTLANGTVATPVDTENVLAGLKYSFADCEFDERAPQNDTFLTDGARTGQLFGESGWVGLKGNSEKTSSILFDLGEKKDNLYSFTVHALGGGYDLGYPDYIDVYGSDDNKSFTFIGRMYAPPECTHYAYTLLLPAYIGARYLRFDFAKGETNYWIEEIEACIGFNEERQKVLFPPLDLENVTEDVFWDASELDYTETINLLLGRPQQIAASFYADMDTRGDETPATTTVLTDGKRASDNYCYHPDWFFSRGNDALDIFYDLGKLSTVESLHVSLLEQTEWGISRPKFMDVFLSDDGENWYKVGTYERGDAELNTGATRLQFDFPLETAYAARFVRFRIESGFLFMDELEAMGKKQVDETTARLSDSDMISSIYYTNAEDEQFATAENTPVKASDINLIYTNGNETEEMLLPYVAYLDENGEIKDTFMDGYMYLGHMNLPSGTQPHLATKKENWEYLYNLFMNSPAGPDALERTVQKVKDALDLPDYKVEVYISVCNLYDTITDFGDVDGDGVSESLATPEGRKKVMEWYMNLYETEFAARGYQNLKLAGFYWFNESVSWENDDSDVIAEVSEYVHGAGYNFVWVPYYTAIRYYLGNELGFDMVSMQPNYVFTNDAPLWRFESTAALTKARKMSVEIEHSYQAMGDPEYARNYMLYLYYGAVTGYMDSIHVYYNDTDNIGRMGYSDDPLCRMQYDATYQFAKGTLDITPASREKLALAAGKDTILRGQLGEEGELARYTLTSMPKNGSISLTVDGQFAYYPAKGFTGTDSFTYTYNNYLGESETCVVEITVK